MLTFIYILISLIAGILLRPVISKFLKEHFSFNPIEKRFEIEFRIEFYSQPSIHHLGEQGILVKTDVIKLQIDATDENEALDVVEQIVKQEVKSELVSIKEIHKI